MTNLLQARTLDAKRMRLLLWEQNLLLFWVLDTLRLLLAPEVVCLVIGLVNKQIILIAAKPQSEACLLPKLLKECLTLFWILVEGILLIQVVVEPGETSLAHGMNLRVEGLESVLLVCGQITSTHWKGEVGCALVDGKLACLLTHLLDDLDAGGTCTYNRTTLVGVIDAFLGPEGRVVDLALEAVKTGHIWDI